MNISSAGSADQRTAEGGLAGRLSVTFHDAATLCDTDAANQTLTMTVRDRVVIFITDGTYTTSCVLPPVAEASGMFFSFSVQTDGGQNVTITDKGDDTDFDDLTLADVNDRCLTYSDGIHWHAIDTGSATIS